MCFAYCKKKSDNGHFGKTVDKGGTTKYNSYRAALEPLLGEGEKAEANWKRFVKTVPKELRGKWWARRKHYQEGLITLDKMVQCIESVGGEATQGAEMPDTIDYKFVEITKK